MESTVYIVNKSAHDFKDAQRFGNIVFMTEGRMNRYATNDMHRQFNEALEGSKEDDYIIPCSLNVMNAIVCSIFAVKHRKLNLLLFNDRKKIYVERNHVFE